MGHCIAGPFLFTPPPTRVVVAETHPIQPAISLRSSRPLALCLQDSRVCVRVTRHTQQVWLRANDLRVGTASRAPRPADLLRFAREISGLGLLGGLKGGSLP